MMRNGYTWEKSVEDLRLKCLSFVCPGETENLYPFYRGSQTSSSSISLSMLKFTIYHSFWTELDLPTNQIPVSKLAQQRGGHGERYQRDLPWFVLPRDEKRELAGKC